MRKDNFVKERVLPERWYHFFSILNKEKLNVFNWSCKSIWSFFEKIPAEAFSTRRVRSQIWKICSGGIGGRTMSCGHRLCADRSVSGDLHQQSGFIHEWNPACTVYRVYYNRVWKSKFGCFYGLSLTILILYKVLYNKENCS